MKLAVSGLMGAAALAAALVPAAATARDRDGARAMAVLSNPESQAALGEAMAGLVEALMQVRAAPFVKALDRADPGRRDRGIDPDATLGDLAGPEARAVPRQIEQRLPQMMGAMAGMAEAVDAMRPQLEAMAKQMQERMAGTVPNGRSDQADPADTPPPADAEPEVE